MSESSPAKLVALLHEALPSLQAMDEGDAEMSWAMFLADEIVANRAALSSWQRLALLVRETLDMDVHSDALPASLPTLFDKLTAAGILPSAAKSTENLSEEEWEADGSADVLDDDEESIQVPDGDCVLCERTMALTLHHLIPREVHEWYKNHHNMSKAELHAGIMICRDCHSAVHKFEDNKTLAAEYSTLDKLLEHPRMSAWLSYIRKRRPTSKADKRTWRPSGPRDLPPRYED